MGLAWYTRWYTIIFHSAYFLATKKDNGKRQVSYEQGKSFAQKRQVAFVEVDLNNCESVLEFLEVFGDKIRSFVEKLTPKSPRARGQGHK